MDSKGDIVVGVDGSAASLAALRWAADRARLEHRPLRAVEVTRPPRLAPASSYAVQPYGTTMPSERMHDAQRLHETVVAAVGDDTGVTELRVDGEPAAELLRAAKGASMLVLGHPTRAPLTEVVLGSVAASCARHADCPVVLVPPA